MTQTGPAQHASPPQVPPQNPYMAHLEKLMSTHPWAKKVIEVEQHRRRLKQVRDATAESVSKELSSTVMAFMGDAYKMLLEQVAHVEIFRQSTTRWLRNLDAGLQEVSGRLDALETVLDGEGGMPLDPEEAVELLAYVKASHALFADILTNPSLEAEQRQALQQHMVLGERAVGYCEGIVEAMSDDEGEDDEDDDEGNDDEGNDEEQGAADDAPDAADLPS